MSVRSIIEHINDVHERTVLMTTFVLFVYVRSNSFLSFARNNFDYSRLRSSLNYTQFSFLLLLLL
jgi:hypothetical protein